MFTAPYHSNLQLSVSVYLEPYTINTLFSYSQVYHTIIIVITIYSMSIRNYNITVSARG